MRSLGGHDVWGDDDHMGMVDRDQGEEPATAARGCQVPPSTRSCSISSNTHTMPLTSSWNDSSSRLQISPPSCIVATAHRHGCRAPEVAGVGKEEEEEAGQRRGRRGKRCIVKCENYRSGPNVLAGRPNITGAGGEEHEEAEDEGVWRGFLHTGTIDPGMGEPDPPTPTPESTTERLLCDGVRTTAEASREGQWEGMHRAKPQPSLPSVGSRRRALAAVRPTSHGGGLCGGGGDGVAWSPLKGERHLVCRSVASELGLLV